MKVKITQCHNNKWWYNNRINEIFEVLSKETFDDNINYKVYQNKFNTNYGYILDSDCEICKEIPVKQKQKIYKTINLRRDYDYT
jgi:Holliday junction resolvase RusA-like endonuclease